jgi:hypothetical protein
MLRIRTFYVPRTLVIFIINTCVKRFCVLNLEETRSFAQDMVAFFVNIVTLCTEPKF